MNDLDQKIQAALRALPGGDALAGEPNIGEELLATFRGRRRWLHALAFVWTLALVAVLVWAGYRFYAAEPLRDQLWWGGVAFTALLMVAMLKIYFWLELHTNRVLREVKRVELLLATRSAGK